MDSSLSQVEQSNQTEPPLQPVNNQPKNSSLLKWFITIIVVALLFSGITYLAIIFKSSNSHQSIKVLSTVDKNVINSPTVSSPIMVSKQIAFLRNGDIWMSDENGKDQKKITSNTHIEGFKRIPNSTKIVYYSVSNTNPSNIRTSIVDWDTLAEKAVHEVTVDFSGHGGPGLDLLYYLTVSPDGKKIAYSEGLIYPNEGFMVYDIASGKEELYTKCANDPVFSQDGSIIANILWGNIIICSSVNNDPEILTNFTDPRSYKGDYAKYAYPHSIIGWSKDDQKIYYVISNMGAGNYEWTTVNNIEAVDVKSRQVEKTTDFPPGKYTRPLDFYSNNNTISYIQISNIVYDKSGKQAGGEINNMYGAQFDSQGYRISSNLSLQNLNLDNLRSSELLSPSNFSQIFPDKFSTFYTISPDGDKFLYNRSRLVSGHTDQKDIWQLTLNNKISSLLIEDATNPQWIY